MKCQDIWRFVYLFDVLLHLSWFYCDLNSYSDAETEYSNVNIYNNHSIFHKNSVLQNKEYIDNADAVDYSEKLFRQVERKETKD